DLWLRIGLQEIQRTTRVLGSTRLSNRSMTCRPGTYEQFIKDKITALRRQLDRLGPSHVLPRMERHFISGIYTWAAESISRLSPHSQQYDQFCKLAAEADPYNTQLPLRAKEAALREAQAAAHEIQTELGNAKLHLYETRTELAKVRWSLQQHEQEVA